MKLVFNLVIILVSAALGLALGIAMRSGPKPKASVPKAASPAATSDPKTLGRSKPSVAIPVRDDSPLTTKLERDLSMSSGVTRWLFWLDALEKAAPHDFPRLARLAQGNSTALRFVAARWVEVDPRHMFESLVAAYKSGQNLPVNELAQTLFAEWPKRDPEAVIAALSGPPELMLGNQSSWRMQVANTILDNDVERGLKLLHDWHIDNYGPRMGAVAKWAAADPRHAAEFALKHPAGYASRMTMETIGKEWAKTDPAAALEFAGTQRGELGSALAGSAVKEWAGRDLKGAAEWLAGADQGTRNRLSSAFVEVWAKQDAADALEWCALNLSGTSLAQAVGGVLKGAAQKDLAKAQALVAGMNPSAARAEGAAAVAEKAFPNSMSEKPIAPDTIAWLKRLDPHSLKRTLDEVHWRWMASDPASMAEFLKSYDTEALPSHIYSNLARRMARKSPEAALEWSSQLPAEHSLSAANEAFAQWRSSQPDLALKWLLDLPQSDVRRQPFVESVVQVFLAHERSTEGEQVAAMTAPTRAAARRLVETLPPADERRAKLLGMLQP